MEDIFSAGSERVLCHTETPLFMSLQALKVSTWFCAQSEGETARTTSKESRHPLRNFRNFTRKLQYGEKREATFLHYNAHDVAHELHQKFPQNLLPPITSLVSSYIRDYENMYQIYMRLRM